MERSCCRLSRALFLGTWRLWRALGSSVLRCAVLRLQCKRHTVQGNLSTRPLQALAACAGEGACYAEGNQ